ncbi:sterol desaturase family protein [Lacihabitans sp. CS3-21]|uniref:sterol desaturase family protein n=1 Tax=Lacihabitans sp. CS3-21 TaxID=2487332 RepID=UPI0020CF337C|nr:sterol desaturase family protein [Lacihabitans sp. CS3-21]MCP9748553.1 sterol desaturase family protein [Lacihabitans sp. CS3-21]
METYAKILLIASPIFLFLVMAEKLYGYLRFKHEFRTMDTISSLSSGYSNTLKDVLGLSITIISYKWFYDHVALFEIKSTIWVYIIAFIALDFSGYWVHRLAHEVNFFWNKHAIHHSSEEFNLACALRQSISTFVNIFTFFLIPAAIFGVKPEVIGIVAPIQLFAQFWYHTVYIDRMGFLEKIIVTPSHHRVHHALNPEYLDKNHGQIFIIWDKLFGTFQEELPNLKPVYGITRPMATWNPIKINFKHLWLLILDAWRADSWKDKFRIWFMPTGWRPDGFEEKYPVDKITNPYNFQKYATEFSVGVRTWIWVQFFITLGFLTIMFYYFGNLSLTQLLLYGLMIFLNIYAYTEFMDKNPSFLFFELIKNLYGIGMIAFTNFWNPLFEQQAFFKPIFLTYFITSTLVSIYYFRSKVVFDLKTKTA